MFLSVVLMLVYLPYPYWSPWHPANEAILKAEADTAYRPPPWSQEAVVIILLIECVRDAEIEPDTGPVGQRNGVIGR